MVRHTDKCQSIHMVASYI